MTVGRRSAARPSWATYRESIGDRSALFAEVVAMFGSRRALYLGSYLDLAPSSAIASVTYVDLDRRAARYFADPAQVSADLEGRTLPGAGAEVRFLEADYVSHLAVDDGAFDLVVSLFAGPTWDHPLRYLAPGGLFLANASHGDASLAALDPRLELVAAVRDDGQHPGGTYRLDREDLDTYLVPKKPAAADAELIRSSGKGIAYTRQAFAYVFRLL